MSGVRPQEYTICIDSRNRDTNIYKEPNDFKLDINFSRALPVQRIYLGSIELPVPQYIIEEEWSRLYLSEGLALIVNNMSEECLREFTLREWDGTIIHAQLPIWLNAIIDIDTTTPTSPIFTTALDHGLHLRGEWNWGSPMRLISTVLTDPSLINLTEDNVNLTILSATMFQLDNVPAAPALVANQGYLHAPAIPNPAILARIVTNALNMESSNIYSVTFDGQRNEFCLKLNSLPCSLRNTGDMPCQPGIVPATIITNGTNCLPYIMGFGCTDLPLPPGEDAVTKGVCGSFCYQCMSYIQLTPGNYNVDTFPAEFSTQANRFYFEPTCMPGGTLSGVAIPPPTLIFSDECGQCYSAIIPFGKYSPTTLAAALQDAMNTAASSTDYVVTYDTTTGKFIFSTISGALFGLEFDDPRNNSISFIGASGHPRELSMSTRLGFTTSCYRGDNMYMSNRTFHVPTKGCSCTTIPQRLLSNIYIPMIDRSKKEFGINACRTRVSNGTLTDEGTGYVRIDTTILPVPPAPTPPEYAHGFQPEDVINVTDQITGDTYQMVVAEVLSATSFLAEIEGTPFTGAVSLDVCVSLFGPVIVNLFFGNICSGTTIPSIAQTNIFPENTIRSEITGFPATAILWEGPSSLPHFAPNQFNLDPPDYLLIQLVSPNESRFIQHEYNDDNITSLFGKIVIYPAVRMERAFPIETIFQGSQIINQLHFRILTPDHRLYKFHGRNWSATLMFVVANMSISSTCY